MNSCSEPSIIISTQETPLVQNDPAPTEPPQPRIKNLKTKISFLVRIIIVLIAGFLILYFIYTKNRNPDYLVRNHYLSGLSNFYCHLTRHPKLCHDSMSSITNATALEPDPALIFAASLQLVVIELNHSTNSIAKALSAPNASLVVPRLSTCQTLMSDSLSRLNRSFDSLGVDLFFESSEDHINITDEVRAVRINTAYCLSALREVEGLVQGVEEVNLGLERSRKLLVNFISLFNQRHYILDHFANRFTYFDDQHYNYLYNYYFYFDNYYWYGFDYGFMVCLYSVMYMFVALLYFLFWQ